MNTRMRSWESVACAALAARLLVAPTLGGRTVFFDLSQGIVLDPAGTTSDTLRTEGYQFTVTRDKLFTGGVGLTNPIGRSVRVPWPDGLEAQAVTAGPSPGGARIDVKREDGQPFAIESFTARLLANTAGAGGSFEIMPLLGGEDGLPDPLQLNATGIAGNSFTHATPQLTGFDAYKITLYVDFALTRLTVVDASVPPPTLAISQIDAGTIELSWPADSSEYNLESAVALPAPSWQPVATPPVPVADRLTVRVAPSGNVTWFRLRK